MPAVLLFMQDCHRSPRWSYCYSLRLALALYKDKFIIIIIIIISDSFVPAQNFGPGACVPPAHKLYTSEGVTA